MDNLYVVDAAFSPRGTIMANALRIADRLRERLG
jgi:hypothetical protein